MMLWTLLAVFVGMALGNAYDNDISQYYGNRNLYNGLYSGKCANDGFYYQNEYSFMICSNGNSYEQRCAPGSKNSGYGNYKSGRNYYYHDFCDVNLVDHGYGVNKGYAPDKGYGYADNKAYGYKDNRAYGFDNHGRDSYGYKESYNFKESFGRKNDFH